MASRRDQRSAAAMPRAIWILGVVSLFMDVSSEMIHSLLPVFLVGVLGASPAMVGLIEGVAEATASGTKIFSGVLSDRFRRRKPLTVAGYLLAALTKPLFPLAQAPAWILAARFVDRIGKGVREAPRDALLADLAPAERRGAGFGLRQSLDTIGAFAGPLLAIALMMLTADSYRTVFWIAAVPAFLAVLLLVLGVREPAPAGAQEASPPLRLRDCLSLGASFWWVVGVFGVFSLGRFSEAFLVLRATEAGLEVALAPLVYVVMNTVYALTAFPAGRLSDAIGRWGLLMLGVPTLVAADLVLGLGAGIPAVGLGVALWGLHLGLTQGIFSALVSDVAPVHLRGTAFGVFNLAGGGASLLSSVIAGALWTRFSSAATFLAGAALAAGVLVAAAFLRGRIDGPQAGGR